MRSYSRNAIAVASFATLFLITACGGGSSGDASDESTRSDDALVNPSTNSNAALSCSGARIWGPIPVESDLQYYVSETSGSTNPPDCAAFWEYDANQNCSNGFLLDPIVIIDVLNNGDIRYTEGEYVFQVPPANISLMDLDALPDCGSNTDGGITQGNDNPPGTDNGSGEGSNGAAFGVDLPAYKDLVLINSRSFVFGLDGLLLPTIKQTPVMRFNDGTVTRDLTDWINGQRSSLGQWSTDASGNVTVTFDGQNTTSITAPVVASRSPRDFYHCFKKVASVSVLGSNAIIYNDYCFNSNGSFTSTGGASNSGQSSDSGTYQVDGNVIKLSFSDGGQEIQLFGTYADSSGAVYAISIGEAVYNKLSD